MWVLEEIPDHWIQFLDQSYIYADSRLFVPDRGTPVVLPMCVCDGYQDYPNGDEGNSDVSCSPMCMYVMGN